jgi:hypothetical protein
MIDVVCDPYLEGATGIAAKGSSAIDKPLLNMPHLGHMKMRRYRFTGGQNDFERTVGFFFQSIDEFT